MSLKKNRTVLMLLFFVFLGVKAQKSNKTMALKEIITAIQNQHHLVFNYTNDRIESIKIIAPNVHLSLAEKIEYLQKNTSLSFENIDNMFINIYDSKFNLCGYLYNSIDQKPIANALILTNTHVQTTTNLKGYFEITSSQAIEVFIQANGFFLKKILLSKSEKCLDIFLNPQIINLDEVRANSILTTGIYKKNDGSFRIKPQQLGLLPGLIEPDILQTMQQIPGIGSADESVANINIRGSTHDQNLFLWNGIKMYQTGHFFGLISAFNPNLPHTIAIYKNGSSAFFGESVSGVVAISTTPEHASQNSFSIGANLINLDGYFKKAISKNGFIEIAARKSITDFIDTPTYDSYSNKAFQNTIITDFSENQNQNVNYSSDKKFNFYDLTFKYFDKIGLKNQFCIDFIGIEDKLNVNQTAMIKNTSKKENDELIQKNYGGSFSFERVWNKNTKTKINLYSTFYNLLATKKINQTNQILFQKNSVLENGLNIENDYIISNKISFNHGYQLRQTIITNLDEVNSFNSQENKGVLNTHALVFEGKYKDTVSRIHLTTGLRCNYFETFHKFITEPRIQFNYGLSKSVSLEILGELKSQTTQQIIDLQKDYLGIEKRRWILSDLNTVPIQQSKQLSVNISFKKNDWLFSLENFYKEVNGITSQSQGFQNQLELLKITGSYKVLGTEILIQKRINHFSNWLTYTYNSNKYTFQDFEPSVFFNNFHIAHALSWAGVFEKNNFNIALGARWNSGRPETTPATGFIDASNPVINYNYPNNERQDPFFQVNISSTYKWQDAKHTQYKIGLSILNLLNTQNEISEYYRISNLTNAIEEVKTFALKRTPNISFRIVF